MVLTENHRQLLGRLPVFSWMSSRENQKIFLGGGSSLLLPNPPGGDAPVCEPGVHTQSLGDILSAALWKRKLQAALPGWTGAPAGRHLQGRAGLQRGLGPHYENLRAGIQGLHHSPDHRLY